MYIVRWPILFIILEKKKTQTLTQKPKERIKYDTSILSLTLIKTTTYLKSGISRRRQHIEMFFFQVYSLFSLGV